MELFLQPNLGLSRACWDIREVLVSLSSAAVLPYLTHAVCGHKIDKHNECSELVELVCVHGYNGTKEDED